MKKIIVLNHKMNFEKDDIVKYIRNIKDMIPADKEVVICPSSCFIPYFDGKYNFKLGAQNGMYKVRSSCTGEISFEQLKSFNVKYALIGHSERIAHFNESNQMINKKIKSCLDNNILPMLCIGETDVEKSLRKTPRVITNKIKECLSGIKIDDSFIIIYEPVWAIGSGKIPNSKEISEIVNFIKDLVYLNYKVDIKVLYGGSVNATTLKTLVNIEELDGFLIGSASVDVEQIKRIFDII